MSSFTNEDRKALYEQGAELRMLMNSFKDLREELRENGSPTNKEFAELKGKVESLQNFRWWLAGIAAASGVFTHFLLGKL